MAERLHAKMAKRVIAIASAIAAMGGLIALQAQDIVDEVIGLRGRDDEVGHVAMAGLKEHFKRERRGRCPVGDRREIRGTALGSGGSCLDRVTIRAPGLSQATSSRGTL